MVKRGSMARKQERLLVKPCSMSKKIESLRKQGKRAEGIDDVVNANAAAKINHYSGKGDEPGRYAAAQDTLNYNKQNTDRKVGEFLHQYIRQRYGVQWVNDYRTKEGYKMWFTDKGKLQELIDTFVKYDVKKDYGWTLSPSHFKVGRSVVISPSRVEGLIKDTYEKCPEWQDAFKEFIGDDVREPVDRIKRSVSNELDISPEWKQYVSDIDDFQKELATVIRNAVKLRTEVNYDRRWHDDMPFKVSVNGGFNDKASKSITDVLNKIAAKYDPVPGGKRVDTDAAAKVLAELEKALS